MRKRLGIVVVVAALTGAAGCGSGSDSAAEVVAPAGAPYSYTVPDGFEEATPTAPPGQRFLTTVVPAGSERQGYLGVYQWSLGKPERGYATARLLAWLDRSTLDFYRGAGATVSAGERRTVAGRPAVCWRIRGFRNRYEGVVDASSCAVVAGPGVAVEQSCSWKPASRATMQRGCRELLAGLEVG